MPGNHLCIEECLSFSHFKVLWEQGDWHFVVTLLFKTQFLGEEFTSPCVCITVTPRILMYSHFPVQDGYKDDAKST